MPTDDEVRAARSANDALRQQISEKQTENRRLAEDANNEYRLQRFARESEDLQRQLDTLEAQAPVSIPQPFDETQVYADTVQPDAQPEVANQPPPPPRPRTDVPSTPPDVATINPQGE